MVLFLFIYFGALLFALFTGNVEGGFLIAIVGTIFSPGLGAAFHSVAFGHEEVRPGGGVVTVLLMALMTYWAYRSNFSVTLVDVQFPGIAWLWAGAALGYKLSNDLRGGHDD